MLAILAKKIIFSDEAHFDLGGYASKIVAFGAQKTRTHTLKIRRTQNDSLFAADFASLQRHNCANFLFENEQGEAVTVNGDRLTEDADFGKKKIIFSDESHFDLGRYVIKQNCRI